MVTQHKFPERNICGQLFCQPFQFIFGGRIHPSTRTFFPDAVSTTSLLFAPPDNLAAFEEELTAAAYPSSPRTFLAAFLIASQLSVIDSVDSFFTAVVRKRWRSSRATSSAVSAIHAATAARRNSHLKIITH